MRRVEGKSLRQVRKEIQDRIEEEARRLKAQREWLASDDDREGKIEVKFVARMLDEKWMHIKADRLYRGWSDQFFFGAGPRTVIIEFKSNVARDGRQGVKLQAHFRALFRELGFEVYRAKGWAEAEALFRAINPNKALRAGATPLEGKAQVNHLGECVLSDFMKKHGAPT